MSKNRVAYNHGRDNGTKTIPYTYLVINKTTNKKYYGVRYCCNCNPSDLWKTYFTSSKVIHAMIDQYGVDDFEFCIRKTFNDKENAIDHERKVILRMRLFDHPAYLNRSGSDGFKNVANKGETILIKNIELNKAMRWNISKPIPDGWERGSLQKHKESHTKGRIWIHNPLTEESMMVLVDQIIPDGWDLGRPKSFYDDIKERRKNKKHIWITDGIISKQIDAVEVIPDGFYRGRTTSETFITNVTKANKIKRICITNGIINKRILENEQFPEGFVIGLTISEKEKDRLRQVSKEIALRNTDMKFINNGIIQEKIHKTESLPKGFVYGKLLIRNIQKEPIKSGLDLDRFFVD